MSVTLPTEDGWPYPDSGPEQPDLSAETDDDLLSMTVGHDHLLDHLNPFEQRVVAGRYGLDGSRERSMRELQAELGCDRAKLRDALGSGLAKLRHDLMA